MKTITLSLVLSLLIFLPGCSSDETPAAFYTVSVSSGSHGTAVTDHEKAVQGKIITLNATPEKDYRLSRWTILSGEADLKPSSTANPATFAMPAGNIEVKAEFEPTAEYVARLAADAVVVFDREASDATKTVYRFTFPEGVAGASAVSVQVTSASSTIASSLEGNVLSITYSAMEAAKGPGITVAYKVSYGGVTSAESVSKRLPFTGVAKIKVGVIYYEKGEWLGVVCMEPMNPVGINHALVMYKYKSEPLAHSIIPYNTYATNETNGANNLEFVKMMVPSWETNCPAFKWCTDVGEGWYLPAVKELEYMFSQVSDVDKILAANGGHVSDVKDIFWSSTQGDFDKAYTSPVFTPTGPDLMPMVFQFKVRPVRAL